MIAHRLSTVVGVDTIYVLKDGKIVEKGNCKELLSQKGLFYDMWNNYKCSVEWKVAKEA